MCVKEVKQEEVVVSTGIGLYTLDTNIFSILPFMTSIWPMCVTKQHLLQVMPSSESGAVVVSTSYGPLAMIGDGGVVCIAPVRLTPPQGEVFDHDHLDLGKIARDLMRLYPGMLAYYNMPDVCTSDSIPMFSVTYVCPEMIIVFLETVEVTSEHVEQLAAHNYSINNIQSSVIVICHADQLHAEPIVLGPVDRFPIPGRVVRSDDDAFIRVVVPVELSDEPIAAALATMHEKYQNLCPELCGPDPNGHWLVVPPKPVEAVTEISTRQLTMPPEILPLETAQAAVQTLPDGCLLVSTFVEAEALMKGGVKGIIGVCVNEDTTDDDNRLTLTLAVDTDTHTVPVFPWRMHMTPGYEPVPTSAPVGSSMHIFLWRSIPQ